MLLVAMSPAVPWERDLVLVAEPCIQCRTVREEKLVQAPAAQERGANATQHWCGLRGNQLRVGAAKPLM